MEKNYTLKAILFGLRNEYLENQRALNELKQYMKVTDKKIKDFEFSLYQPVFKKHVELMIDIERKQSAISRIVDEISMKLGTYIYSSNSSEMVRNNNNEYFLNRSDYQIAVDDKKQGKFAEQAFAILHSDFAENIGKRYIESDKAEGIVLDITPSYLNFHIGEGRLSDSGCEFLPKDDAIFFWFNTFASNELIAYLLDVEFPRDMFPKYHQCMIEESKAFNKMVDIYGNDGQNKRVNFSIAEDDKRIVLMKK